MRRKALVLLSGGLDSILAVKLLQEQNIEVKALCFQSNFFDCKKAEQASSKLKIELIKKDISKEILKIVKKPKYGYGKNLNPCRDCRLLMLKTAIKINHDEKLANFVATGEVLNQRPFSSSKKTILIKEFQILRPLSAKLLPETKVEKNKFVNRNKLLNIQGKSRQKQLKLAEKFKLKNYPSPAGGCLLTDPSFCKKLKQMLENWHDCDVRDVELLKYGRIFWINFKNKKILTVIGRNKDDNDKLVKLAKDNDILFELKNLPGPTTLARIKNEKIIANKEIKIKVPKKIKLDFIKDKFLEIDKVFQKIALLTAWYSVKARGKEVVCKIQL